MVDECWLVLWNRMNVLFVGIMMILIDFVIKSCERGWRYVHMVHTQLRNNYYLNTKKKQRERDDNKIILTTHSWEKLKMTSQEGSKALLHLYKHLLRSCAKYPSKNRWGIYDSIREEFRVRFLIKKSWVKIELWMYNYFFLQQEKY